MFRLSLGSRKIGRRFGFESLEFRHLMAADPLPVLMVIADQADFYYQEYGDTRLALEAAGVQVEVAATTTNPTFPHPGSGQGSDSGMVTPDLALTDVAAADYSAIVFVGGWGSSMYQYAYPGDYANNRYDGDAATQSIANDLIGDFLFQDKYVTAICHGVTVLAWARIDGVSPIDGRTVSVPWIGSPATLYQGQWYDNYQLTQYEQVVANGATANVVSGEYGDPATEADDVVVDGRIITAENFNSATQFGTTIAQHVIADAQPPENRAPEVVAFERVLPENQPAGTVVGVVFADDQDSGQSLTFAIISGNTDGAFAIDSATGQITVANSAALDYETTPIFNLTIEATDNGMPALSGTAVVTVYLEDLTEPATPVSLVDGNLLVQGTSANDCIYIWTSHTGQLFAWLNGQMFGPYTLPVGGRAIVHAGDGNDQVYATDSQLPVTIFGEAGHDQITGGASDDWLDGGDGVDRIWAGQGNDVVMGGAGNDHLDGREGDDLVSGGDGDDVVAGLSGRDVLLGGAGYDRMDGGADEDLLIGSATAYDTDELALLAILSEWRSAADFATRTSNLANGLAGGIRLRWGETVHDDGIADCLNGSGDADWLFLLASDCQYYVTPHDLVTSG